MTLEEKGVDAAGLLAAVHPGIQIRPTGEKDGQITWKVVFTSNGMTCFRAVATSERAEPGTIAVAAHDAVKMATSTYTSLTEAFLAEATRMLQEALDFQGYTNVRAQVVLEPFAMVGGVTLEVRFFEPGQSEPFWGCEGAADCVGLQSTPREIASKAIELYGRFGEDARELHNSKQG